MKRYSFLLILLILLTGCSQQESKQQETPKRSYEHISFVSSITADDCLLCGSTSDHEISQYVGQDNLGLVDVNSFDIALIEINRYSKEGILIEEAAGYMRMGLMQVGDCRVSAMSDVDRGYSHISITPSGTGISPDSISDFLCQDCLDSFSKQYFEDETPPEIAIINFSTKEIRPLVKSCPWFTFGSFCVDCRFEEDGDIDLGIYYRPIRYQE